MNVLIPTQLRSYTEGASSVEGAGDTLADVLGELDRRFPGIRFRMIDEQDRIREHIRIFVGGEDVKSIDIAVQGREVQIVGALSGG